MSKLAAPMLFVALLCGLGTTTRADSGGTDFGVQASVLYRVAACGGDAAVPPRFRARTIASHCRSMTELYASYRRAWADPYLPT